MSKPSASPQEEPAGSAALIRRYLYITAAITGGSVMVAQILGAKMLAPFLGLSHFVWTAQIAVTLVALAAGYYAGGRLADRTPNVTAPFPREAYPWGEGGWEFPLSLGKALKAR